MLLGIHHIGIAVKNLDEATQVFINALGAQVESIHDASSRGIRVALISVGDSMLELVQPADKEGVMAKYIESQGEGIHHICFAVDNINKELESLAAKGIKLRDKEARQGVTGKIAFINPESTNGVLTELIEKVPPSTPISR